MTTLAKVASRALRALGIAEDTAGACVAPECQVQCSWTGSPVWCCYDCNGHLYCNPYNSWPNPCRFK